MYRQQKLSQVSIIAAPPAYRTDKRRINAGQTEFLQLRDTIWQLKIRLRILNAAVRSVTLCRRETLPLGAEEIRRLETFDHWYPRSFLKVSLCDGIFK